MIRVGDLAGEGSAQGSIPGQRGLRLLGESSERKFKPAVRLEENRREGAGCGNLFFRSLPAWLRS